MKRQFVRIAAIDAGVMILFCIIRYFGESTVRLLEYSYMPDELTAIVVNVAAYLLIPAGYVFTEKITGEKNDFLHMCNIPLMAAIAGVMIVPAIMFPEISAYCPEIVDYMSFASCYSLSHILLRFAGTGEGNVKTKTE